MIYIPYGRECLPGTILYHSGLRSGSFPFDAVIAEPEYLRQSLETDFSDWFKKENLYSVNHDSKVVTGNLKYPTIVKSNLKEYDFTERDVFFNHHDLLDEDVVLRYKNKIKNFKEAISSSEHIVFITSINPADLISNGLFEYFNRSGKTSYISCVWTYSEKRSVTKSIEFGIDKISFSCKEKFEDKEMLNLVGDQIRSLTL